MKDDQRLFLSLGTEVPARLTPEQTAWKLNFQPHDVPILVKAGILKPLGNPPPNALKYFAAQDILELCKDRVRLAKATNAIHQHWRRKNEPRQHRFGSGNNDAGQDPLSQV